MTHALGSCVAVCLWDPVSRVGGMLHFLLPESSINPERAREQPATFADTGIPLLFQTAYGAALSKTRCRVQLVGGAAITGGPERRSTSASGTRWPPRSCCGRTACCSRAKSLGGTDTRTVSLLGSRTGTCRR